MLHMGGGPSKFEYKRIRGGGCFGPLGEANRIEIGVISLQDCADKVASNLKCSPFFEFDAGASGGVLGHGWCGCGALVGNRCEGVDAAGATNSSYEVIIPPPQMGGWIFVAIFFLGAVLYAVGGAVFAVKIQGKDRKRDGVASMFPHRKQFLELAGLVSDGFALTVATAKAQLNGPESYEKIIDGAGGGNAGEEEVAAALAPVAAAAAGSDSADSDSDLAE
eukprot:SAG11_NODE_1601_length_4605_cov_2.581891_2_plen_221_part_00